MRFEGRGFPAPLLSPPVYTASGVTIRVDDRDRPEAWAEFHLTYGELAEMLRVAPAVVNARPFPAADDDDPDAVVPIGEVAPFSDGPPTTPVEVEVVPGSREPHPGVDHLT